MAAGTKAFPELESVVFYPTPAMNAIANFKKPDKRTRVLLTDEQKQWSIMMVEAFILKYSMQPPPSWYSNVLWKVGQMANLLREDNNPEGIRAHCEKQLKASKRS